MDARAADRRALALLAATVVVVSRLVDVPAIWLVAILLAAAVALGALWILAEDEARGVAVEALVLPAVAALSGLLALRLVPIGLLLVPAFPLAWLLVDRALWLEARAEARPSGPTPADRSRIIGLAVLLGFLAFAGVDALVGGGSVGASDPTSTTASSDPLGQIVVVLADATVALLLGYRLAALRTTEIRRVAASAVTYAAAIAVAAGGLALLDLPGFVTPAVLALVLFLWDAVSGPAPGSVRDARWLWEIALLGILGILVVALNARLVG
jgi:hypothetical protein